MVSFEWNLIRRNGEPMLFIQWQEWNKSWNLSPDGESLWSKKVPWEIVQVTVFVDIWKKR